MSRPRRVCFVVNPIAGLGGPFGLKGSDDLEAIMNLLARGVKPRAPLRAERFLRSLRERNAEFITAGGLMGADELKKEGLRHVIVHHPSERTTPLDTRITVAEALNEGAELVVFVGGDGTARDVAAVGGGVPILGVPAGVKVYSGVFGTTPESAAAIFDAWMRGEVELVDAEILDVDERELRSDVLRVSLCSVVKTPKVPGLLQPSKGLFVGVAEEDNKKAIARYVAEEKIKDGVLYVLGPGSTIKALADELGVEKTLLGVDLYANGRIVAKDVDEETVLRYMKRFPRTVIVVTPIGRQGFILGRGNQQISPRVLRNISKTDLLVLATRAKLRETPLLRVDTGDPKVDALFRGYIRVVVDYREEIVARVV